MTMTRYIPLNPCYLLHHSRHNSLRNNLAFLVDISDQYWVLFVYCVKLYKELSFYTKANHFWPSKARWDVHIISVFLLWSSSLLNQIVICYISQNGLNFQMKAREAWNPRLPILPGAGHFRGRLPRAAWAQPPRPRRGHRRPLRTTLITSVNRWSSLLRSPRESRVLKLLSGLQILSIGQCLWIRGKPFLSPKASKTEVRYILPWTPSFSLKCHLLKGHHSFFDRKEGLFSR